LAEGGKSSKSNDLAALRGRRFGKFNPIDSFRSPAIIAGPAARLCGLDFGHWRRFDPPKPGGRTMTGPISYDECLLLCGAVVAGMVFIMTLSRPA
jgi:hypothetical protein